MDTVLLSPAILTCTRLPVAWFAADFVVPLLASSEFSVLLAFLALPASGALSAAEFLAVPLFDANVLLAFLAAVLLEEFVADLADPKLILTVSLLPLMSTRRRLPTEPPGPMSILTTL